VIKGRTLHESSSRNTIFVVPLARVRCNGLTGLAA
jgi:hypothetical protein